MEKIKYCLACASKMPAEADRCDCCGFEGQNRLFLSEQEFETWKSTVLMPYMNQLKPPELFAGPRHILILRANGDLYAIGDNYSGACGEHLPEELTEPTLIASNVRHAAAGATHTIYVTMEGEVKLIGNSDFADRFDCALTARKVYAHDDCSGFIIEDEEGRLYFAGDNDRCQQIPREYSVLKTLPPVKTDGFYWTAVGNGLNYATGRHTYSRGFSSEAEDFEALRAYKRSDEFRNLVQIYGEENIRITLGQEVRKTLVGTKQSREYSQDITEEKYELEYEPTVRLYNNWIYQPEPMNPFEDGMDWYWGSWKTHPSRNWKVPQNADIVRCAQIEGRSVRRVAGYIAGGTFGIVQELDETEIVSSKAGFADFAWTEYRKNGNNIIALSKENGELLLGSAEEVFAHGSIYHLQPFRF